MFGNIFKVYYDNTFSHIYKIPLDVLYNKFISGVIKALNAFNNSLSSIYFLNS